MSLVLANLFMKEHIWFEKVQYGLQHRLASYLEYGKSYDEIQFYSLQSAVLHNIHVTMIAYAANIYTGRIMLPCCHVELFLPYHH